MPRRYARHLLKPLFLQRIAVKLALFICLLLILLFSILGVILTQIAQEVLKNNIRTSQEKIAAQVAQLVSVSLERPVELVKTTGRVIGRIQLDAWAVETVLVEMSLDFPSLEEIVAVNARGEEIATSNPGHPKKNYRENEAFQQAVKGQPFFSRIHVKEDYLPHRTLALPYRRLGAVQGVLMADVNLRGIWDIVDGIKIGETGRALLISKDGLLIAHPDKKLVLKNLNWISSAGFEKGLLETGGGAEYRGGDGKLFLATYAPVESSVPLFLILEIEAREAYRLVEQMRFIIWAVLVFSLLVSIAASGGIARRLVQPVKFLEDWSRKIAMGDFDFRLKPRTSDELGRLFIRFKRMSERLKTAREREHLAALGVAATTISHKLKNSIVSLKTFAQLLPERKRDPHFMQRFEKDFVATIEHLERIFNNLSQIASTRKPHLEPVDLKTLLQSVEDPYGETWARQKIDFRPQIGSDLPSIRGDREQLSEVLVNLLQNAVQAMPKGGLLVVRAALDENDALVKISVMDSGYGISRQNLDQIFKPFFTTKHGGMGLGLSISKKIIEDHGGTLTAASVEGRGSVFSISLPAIKKKKLLIREPFELLGKK